MSREQSQKHYSSGERPQASTTSDNQTRQLSHRHQLEHPDTTSQSSIRVRRPPLSSSYHTAPMKGLSAMHINPEYNTESQYQQHGSGRGPQVPTIAATELDLVDHNQTRHSAQSHQPEHRYANKISGPAREPGDLGMYMNPEAEEFILHQRQKHEGDYEQVSQFQPWTDSAREAGLLDVNPEDRRQEDDLFHEPQPEYNLNIAPPSYPTFQGPQQHYPGPRAGIGAGRNFRRHAQMSGGTEPENHYRLGIPVPRGRRQLPVPSTFQQMRPSDNAPQDRFRNYITWQDIRSYLGPLGQDPPLPADDDEISFFMPRLMAGLGGPYGNGPITREDTIQLGQFLLRNEVLDRLEQRQDYRHIVSNRESGAGMARLYHQLLRVLLGLWHSAVREGRITGADIERYIQEGSKQEMNGPSGE